MALDIKLDLINKKLINEYISGKDRILQQLNIALRIWWGHWEWATEYGVDYQGSINNKTIIRQQVYEMIDQVDGVQKIISLTIDDFFESNGTGYLSLSASIYIDGELIRIENETLATL